MGLKDEAKLKDSFKEWADKSHPKHSERDRLLMACAVNRWFYGNRSCSLPKDWTFSIGPFRIVISRDSKPETKR